MQPATPDLLQELNRQPDGRIQLQENDATTGIRTKVPSGALVQFKTGGGATGVALFFDADSPFGDNDQEKRNVQAGTVRKPLDAADRTKNVYSYSCELVIGGQRVSWPPPGQQREQGGEMEIVPSP